MAPPSPAAPLLPPVAVFAVRVLLVIIRVPPWLKIAPPNPAPPPPKVITCDCSYLLEMQGQFDLNRQRRTVGDDACRRPQMSADVLR